MATPPRATLAVLGLAFFARCDLLSPSDGVLRQGTWGGDDAGLIVTDSGAHLHVGCTYGEVRGTIPLDAAGHFDVAETHNITAHPVDRGIYLPARLSGRARVTSLTFTVTVDDTVNHRTVVLGPVQVVFGKEPQMGPCPICRTPGDAMARRALLSAPGTRIPESAQHVPARRP